MLRLFFFYSHKSDRARESTIRALSGGLDRILGSMTIVSYWNQRYKKCPDWQLCIGDKLLLSDYLSIHHSRNNTRIAVRLGILAAGLTFISILVSLCVKP